MAKKLVAQEVLIYLGDDDQPYEVQAETVVAEGDTEEEYANSVAAFTNKHGLEESEALDENIRRFELVGFVIDCREEGEFSGT